VSDDHWRRAELESLWFPVVEEAERLRQRDRRLSWSTIANARLRIGESTLRYWRKEYWKAKGRPV